MRGYSENDKDCPVCHSKNLQLVDALRAQSESRVQHEIFHNLLDRSVDPFSVVAEYFGRGMFNKIVIVEEEDESVGEVNVWQIGGEYPDSEFRAFSLQINKNIVERPETGSQPVASNPYNQYGAGAESKLRIAEGQNISKAEAKRLREVPIPEGRMRLQETSRYSTSLEANISRAPEHLKRDHSPRYTPNGSLRGEPAASSNAISSNLANTSKPKNPFEEGDEGAYDESKNPFADDEVPAAPKKPDVDVDKGSNPFEEYDNNLNPFS